MVLLVMHTGKPYGLGPLLLVDLSPTRRGLLQLSGDRELPIRKYGNDRIDILEDIRWYTQEKYYFSIGKLV